MESERVPQALFVIGDYCAGGIIGAATAAAVRAVIGPGWDMVVAMVFGMVAGMIVALALGLVLAPVIGLFQVMIPGSLIGMLGGMLFAMRDSVEHAAGTGGGAILVGAAFGLSVTAVLRLYDRALHGSASSRGPV